MILNIFIYDAFAHKALVRTDSNTVRDQPQDNRRQMFRKEAAYGISAENNRADHTISNKHWKMAESGLVS